MGYVVQVDLGYSGRGREGVESGYSTQNREEKVGVVEGGAGGKTGQKEGGGGTEIQYEGETGGGVWRPQVNTFLQSTRHAAKIITTLTWINILRRILFLTSPCLDLV